MGNEHQELEEQELEVQRLSSRSSPLDDYESSTLRQQLVDASTTIAVLTAQLKTAKETQQKLERELAEARAANMEPQLRIELAVTHEQLKTAHENQRHLEKQLTDMQSKAPKLEMELKEQLKAFDDRLKAAKLEHSLRLEKQELELQSIKEKYETDWDQSCDVNLKVANVVACTTEAQLVESVPAPSEKLYLAPVMMTPATSQELLCVTFITGTSRDGIDEKVQRLQGQLVPGTKAILVESEADTDKIKQTIVDRGHALVKRKRRKNPKLCVDVEFYNEPNKLCTRHADDETTTRDEFLDLFRLPFTPVKELVEQISPLEESVEKIASEEETPVVRRGWRLPVRGTSLRLPQRFGYSSGNSR